MFQKKYQKYFKLEYLAFLIIFILPWQTRFIYNFDPSNKCEYLNYSLYLTDILLIFLIFFHLTTFIKNKNYKIFDIKFLINKIKTHKAKKYFLLIQKNLFFNLIIFEILLILSIIQSENAMISAYKIWHHILGLIFFFLLNSLKIDFKKILISFCLGLLLPACLGIYQFLTQNDFENKWLGLAIHDASQSGISVIETSDNKRFLRSYGSLEHPNILGGTLMLGIFFLIYLYKNTKNTLLASILIISLIIFYTALIFSFSRSAYLSIILANLFYLYFLIKNKKIADLKIFFKFKTIFLILFLINLFCFKEIFLTRFQTNTRLEKLSIQERTSQIENSKNLIKQNFLGGIGIGNYILKSPEKNPQPVHNIFLLISTELGFIALLLFINILKIIFQNNLTQKNYQQIIWIITLIILFNLDHWFFSLHFGILFFYLLLYILSFKNKAILS